MHTTLLKKIAAAALVQVLLAVSVPLASAAAGQSADPVQLNNIVLFAQSAPLTESNFMDGRTDAITSMCNDAGTCHSLAGYVDTISYGKMHVTSYFPQMEGDAVTPYILSSAETDYLSCEQIALEILQNISIPDSVPMDGNGDGVIDNIVLVVDGKAADMSSPIWPRAFLMNGIRINGLSVSRVNIQNSVQLFENQITGAEGVLCHEFLHSLGYPDLYRREQAGTPVGLWDIMASNSVYVQYPLAYQRAKISGWLESRDITESGTYTLAPASSDSGDRLYLLKTPFSDTEFFAVEYRQQGARYSDEMDVKIYGTGLVVYRVNTEEDGNFKGDQDEIYVFRPGETALDAGEGDLFASNFGGENAPDQVGSLDWNAGITDGALVYSNGSNSGIQISNITMDERSLTFSVEFADRADAQLWESVSGDSLGNATPFELEVSQDGTVYMTASDGTYATLYKFDGGELKKLDGSLGSGNAMGMNQPRLAFCGDTPYVLYQDRNFLLHLCRYNASSGSWTEVYRGTELAQYADLTSDGNRLYFTYTTGTFPYALHAAGYDCETETVTVIGESIASNACNMSMAVLNGSPMIAYRDIADGNKAKLAIYSDGAWREETVSDAACGSVAMVSDGNTAWIAPSGSGIPVYRFADGKMTAYPLPESVSRSAFMQIPVTADGRCSVAVNTQDPEELAVYTLNGTNWEMTGNILAMELVNCPSLVQSGQTLYCSCYTKNGTALIRQLPLAESEALMGDVNADGRFDLADVVTMQKWLLAEPDVMLADWKAGDLCTDSRINVLDLCAMKRLLIEK